MIERAKNWFQARSPREKWMLGIAAALLAGAVAVYGVILPGYAAIDAAERDLSAATERRGRIVARAALQSSTPNDASSGQRGASDSRTVEAIVMESAMAGGFEIMDGAATGTDEFAFRLASAKAGPFMAWLTELESQGIELSEIKMRKGEGGFVSADVRLRKKP
jgi:type II secretory pathway component PulM